MAYFPNENPIPRPPELQVFTPAVFGAAKFGQSRFGVLIDYPAAVLRFSVSPARIIFISLDIDK